MTYSLSKSLEKGWNHDLYSPRGICHLYQDKGDELQNCSCNGALKVSGYCKECQLDLQALRKCGCEKAFVYELLRKE